jgi:hypothetical protein
MHLDLREKIKQLGKCQQQPLFLLLVFDPRNMEIHRKSLFGNWLMQTQETPSEFFFNLNCLGD